MPVSHINIIGYQPSGSTTASTVWSQGSTSYVQLTTGTALEAISSSTNDAAAGSGARTIRVDGLNGSYVPFSETVTLNGTNAVALTNTSVIAVNKVTVLTAGSGLVNAGNIDIRTVSGSTIKARIQILPESIGKSAEFVYTIPASTYGLLKTVRVYARTNTGDLWVYLNSYNSSGVRTVEAGASHSLDVAGYADGYILMDFGKGLYIPEKTLITLVSDSSAGTPVVSAIGELELYS